MHARKHIPVNGPLTKDHPSLNTSCTWIIVWSFPSSCEKVVLKEEGGFQHQLDLNYSVVFPFKLWKSSLKRGGWFPAGLEL